MLSAYLGMHEAARDNSAKQAAGFRATPALIVKLIEQPGTFPNDPAFAALRAEPGFQALASDLTVHQPRHPAACRRLRASACGLP